jgi:4-diphosphocytidyl-2-C-methyl-D-erythritol kinase
MTTFSEFARAKINLTLEVLGKRSDGYHELRSLVAFADDAFDVVTLDTSKPVGCEISGPFCATIAGQNLIDVTLAKLAAASPGLQLGAVHLVKSLPVAAGIGGGSADAAAVLRAVHRANPKYSATVDWHALARSLGADVPVCLENRAAWMTGIGDIVHALGDLPKLTGVLVNPLQVMPADKTAQVFRALDAGPVAPDASAPTKTYRSRDELLDDMKACGNALEAAACKIVPIITDVKRAIVGVPGCLYAAVSGGGPTCFGIFADHESTAAQMQKAHPEWWVRPVTLG